MKKKTLTKKCKSTGKKFLYKHISMDDFRTVQKGNELYKRNEKV